MLTSITDAVSGSLSIAARSSLSVGRDFLAHSFTGTKLVVSRGINRSFPLALSGSSESTYPEATFSQRFSKCFEDRVFRSLAKKFDNFLAWKYRQIAKSSDLLRRITGGLQKHQSPRT